MIEEEVEAYRKAHPSQFPKMDEAREHLLNEMPDIDMLAMSCIMSGDFAEWYYNREIGDVMVMDAYTKLSQQANGK